MTASTTTATVDLRRATLADARALDLRGAERDLWADEAALWDRLIATWAGLDDAAWHLPGAAPSDAGGPDWSLAEHIGHIADWQELAADYIPVAIGNGPVAVGRRLRRRRLRPLQRTSAGALDDDVGRGHPRAPDRRPTARAGGRAAPHARDDPQP